MMSDEPHGPAYAAGTLNFNTFLSHRPVYRHPKTQLETVADQR
jgi:hypothetical protein